MTRLRSLRTHIFFGAVLWSVGLFLLASMALTLVMTVHPHAPIVVHGILGHIAIIAGLAFGCLALGFLHVRNGLSAVKDLRQKLGTLHAGTSTRLDGCYPTEVQPLVDDLNALIEARDRAVARALATAGDLAHGLKTPLAVLALEADRTRAAHQPEIAASLSQQIDRMKRHVDYHLAQARAAASGATSAARSSVAESVAGLIRAVERLHADRHLTIESRVADDCIVRVRRPDLDEMLGNLVDNACRWAHSRVVVTATSRDGSFAISVDDDGTGLAPEMGAAVLRRGVRADEAGDGAGLGLAIVKELAELHDGTIALGRSELGGLRAEITLPA